jgi:hypothetical protein
MTNTQESKLHRMGVLISLFERYQAEVNSIPALSRFVLSFTEIRKRIEETHPLQAMSRTGITSNKNDIREDLALQALTISGALHSYASENKLIELSERYKLSLSSYTKVSTAYFKELCLELITDARTYAEKLTDYGVNGAFIEQFATKLENFKITVSEPRNAVVKITYATSYLKDLFAQSDEIVLSHFDKLMIQFKNTRPNFYREYQSARIIENRGVRHIQKSDSPITESQVS